MLCLKADTSSLLKHLIFFPHLLSIATLRSLVFTKVASHCTAAQCSLMPVRRLPKSRDGGTDCGLCEKRRASVVKFPAWTRTPHLPPSPLWDPHRSLQSALSINCLYSHFSLALDHLIWEVNFRVGHCKKTSVIPTQCFITSLSTSYNVSDHITPSVLPPNSSQIHPTPDFLTMFSVCLYSQVQFVLPI